jgi:hypothetical protein
MLSKVIVFSWIISSIFSMFTPRVLFRADKPGKSCDYVLATADIGETEVRIKEGEIKVTVKNGRPDTLYTIWMDFQNRATGQLSADYPLAEGALGRGVAPAFASTAGVTNGMGLDVNGLVTDKKGNGSIKIKLDYNLLETGASPVVGAELSLQGQNRVGGNWLRVYEQDPQIGPSVQVVDAETGLPLLERATAQGITIVRHAVQITHGHTPGVGGVDHFPGFFGDFPASCLP